MNKNDIQASPAQLRYADTLFYGSLIGFVIMLITYVLYVTGILTPQIPLDDLPRLWTGSAADYRAAGSIPQGWGWLALIGKGDICNFVGIIILAGLTIVCFAQLALSLARRKQWLLCVIAILEVLVLVLAASGILVGGGH
ncbi:MULTISPECIES: DUF1634 domain-containing protein [Desulfovibrio]|jgi:uncharacterized membrane protein|uniref:DUF1634 domain-containing protein n=2 Tax=Desulfovibrio TaxID=872 RepID=A0A848CAU7_9BACT|nr:MULTISPECIES: DUF1634 domain-containing protein [Desulfovibrio]MBM6834630.1 DUF1634 domain-containing protein [Desulfovibrio piger]MBM6893320.1 DUF1634 domain-containing protein [Desulfovibrio piger]MBS5807850.1 DUF1634 domain-containing protein [Desulfovibrio piger]MCI6332223.1 DUF1634 domain-containing protein [Desulfovibrio piger]MCI7373647.1 DUF1634 domain-containing protein [Desulfovibrio piger]